MVKWVSVTFILLVLGFVIWMVYNEYFKFVINDYYKDKVEKQLQVNFQSNKDGFEDLKIFSKNFGPVTRLDFGVAEGISLQISDTMLFKEGQKPFNSDNFFTIGEHAYIPIKDINFLDSNSVAVSAGDTTIIAHNWTFDYKGLITDPMVYKLLAYSNITAEQLKQLKEKMKKIDCNAFSKSKELISVRYAGHFMEGFEYLIPISDKLNTGDWHKLSNGYYWVYYSSDLYCGLTDWRKEAISKHKATYP